MMRQVNRFDITCGHAARAQRAVGVLLAAALTAFGCAPSQPETPTPDPSSHRVTLAGAVVGFQGHYGSHVWLGIPFATPPVGTLRWQSAEPAAAWTGTRQALSFGAPCTQLASRFGGVMTARPGTPVGNEDCLYLNIYAPRFAEADVPSADRRLPVMLWIHGGGNAIGQAAFYDAGNLAAMRNVIVVTTNYRLGPFGWFRHAALRGDGTSEIDRSGNFGTLDLIAALHWVQQNISAFGGDPQNVTIFGESAGGTNVFTLLLSPEAHGLFQRAIVESGGLRMTSVAAAEHFTDDTEPGDVNSSNEALLRLLMKDGLASDRTAAKAHLARMRADDVERYLRGKTNFEILSVYPDTHGLGMIDVPRVFRDGTVLPQDDPLEHFARADGYNQVPVMLGTNHDENKLFLFADPTRVRRWLWIIPRLRDEQSYNLSAEYLTNVWKADCVDEPAAAMRRTQGANVFAYRFDWHEEPTILGADLSMMLGAAHAFEIPFVFGHFDLGPEGNQIFTKENEPGRKTLSAQVMSYWTEFVYHGAPGRGREGNLPEWTTWDDSTAAAPKFIVLDTPANGGPRMSSATLTHAKILAAVDTDTRLPTQRDKCRIFRELSSWSGALTRAEYATAGKQGCAAYPYDTYPW